MVVIQEPPSSRAKPTASTSGLSRDEQPTPALMSRQRMGADESTEAATISEEQDRQLRDDYHQYLDDNGISAEQLSYEEYRSGLIAAADHQDGEQSDDTPSELVAQPEVDRTADEEQTSTERRTRVEYMRRGCSLIHRVIMVVRIHRMEVIRPAGV